MSTEVLNRVWMLGAAALSGIFLVSDNTTQFMILCAKNFSFVMALSWMLAITLLGLDKIQSNPWKSSILVVATGFMVGLGADRYMPDDFMYTNQEISRTGDYVLEASWSLIILTVAWSAIKNSPKSAILVKVAAIAAVMSMVSIHIVEKVEGHKTLESGKGIVLLDRGALVGQQWVQEHADFTSFMKAVADQPVGQFDFNTLDNESMTVNTYVVSDKLMLDYTISEKQSYYPLSIRNIVGNAVIFFSCFIVLTIWPSRRHQTLVS